MIEAYGYLRVSARDQGPRGFGLAAQKSMLDGHCIRFKWKLVKVFVERASGLNNKRPIVNMLIGLCKKDGRVLLVPRQCRLSRNAFFVMGLIEEKFKYTSADSPYASDHDKRMQAVMDQREAEKIQDNTRNSLIAAVKKGVKLGGNPKKLKRTLKRKRRAYLKKIKRTIRREQKKYNTMRDLTNRLNRMRLKKLNGKRGGWHVSEVHGILHDLSKLK
jgi:DNA invertase Pin-like site-specific DNA recombinase